MLLFLLYTQIRAAGIAQSVLRLSVDRTARGSNPGGGREFPCLSRQPTQSAVQCVPEEPGAGGRKAAVVGCWLPNPFYRRSWELVGAVTSLSFSCIGLSCGDLYLYTLRLCGHSNICMGYPYLSSPYTRKHSLEKPHPKVICRAGDQFIGDLLFVYGGRDLSPNDDEGRHPMPISKMLMSSVEEQLMV